MESLAATENDPILLSDVLETLPLQTYFLKIKKLF